MTLKHKKNMKENWASTRKDRDNEWMRGNERDGEKKSKCWNVGQRVRKDHARIFNKVLHKVFTAKKTATTTTTITTSTTTTLTMK